MNTIRFVVDVSAVDSAGEPLRFKEFVSFETDEYDESASIDDLSEDCLKTIRDQAELEVLFRNLCTKKHKAGNVDFLD